MAASLCQGSPFNSDQERVIGGGLDLLTEDIFVKAAVWRCRELALEVERMEDEIRRIRMNEIARYRTLRRDVDQIKRAVMRQGRQP